MKLYHTIFSLLFILLLSACSSTDSISYPIWYFNVNDSVDELYGVGASKNLADAKALALSDLASKISLKLDSSLNVDISKKNDDVSKTFRNEIQIISENITLLGLEYSKIEESQGMFFAQVRILKSKLISKLQSSNDELSLQVRDILQSIKHSSCHSITPHQKRILIELLNNLVSNNLIITSLNGTINNRQVKTLQEILQTPILASYTSNTQGVDSYEYGLIDAALLSEYAKFYSIVPRQEAVYNIVNNYKLTKGNETDISLDIAIYDCNNNVIFSAHLKSSSQDLNNAIKRISAQLYKKLKSSIYQDFQS